MFELNLSFFDGYTKIEGMGLLAYQAKPSLRDVAHDVVLSTFTAAGNSISTQLGSFCQDNRYCTKKASGSARPSRTKSHLSGHSSLASQAFRRVSQPSSLRPHWLNPWINYC